MRIKTSVGVTFCICALLFSVSYSFAANSLALTETYQHNSNCSYVFGLPFCDNSAETGKFTITGKISLIGIDISKFDEATKFVIEAGGFSFEALLGDDWKYTRGKTSFNVSYIDRLEESDTAIKYITIKLKWTSKLLTVTVTGLTPDFIYPVIADYYIDDASHNFSGNIIAYIELGDDLYSGYNIFYSGKVTTKITNKKGQESSASKVTLKGKGTETSEDFREEEPESETAAVQ